MPSLDDLKKRIKSVKSTQKITKAMKMVAAAKLKKAQESAEKGRPYSEKMQNIILNLTRSVIDSENAPKLLIGTGKDKTYLCVVMTADRGLCGGFNSNICKLAKNYFKNITSQGKEIKIITVGSKGLDQLRNSYEGWLKRRFNLEPKTKLEQCVLPLGGTREGIFSFMQASIDRNQKKPTVIVPNPFYKIYEGAAKMAGADCFYLNSEKENDFRPDFNSIPEDVLENCQILILCSPSNPTGYCLTEKDYSEVIRLANKFNFIICSDECYVDIYPSDKKAPLGLLEFLKFDQTDPKFAVFLMLPVVTMTAGSAVVMVMVSFCTAPPSQETLARYFSKS